jgi:hypothetical protein
MRRMVRFSEECEVLRIQSVATSLNGTRKIGKIAPKTAKTPALILRNSSTLLNKNHNPLRQRSIITSYNIY